MPAPEAVSNGTTDAVIVAGSINRIALFPGNRPGRKALVEIAGRPMIAYVLDALRGVPGVGRIHVVGAPEVIEYARRWPDVEGVPEGWTLVDNAWRGLKSAQTERVLVCNPDQPLLRACMVEDFLTRALPVDADLVTSWVRREMLVLLGDYPEGEHKFFRFGDGSYSHGNLFLVRRDFPEAPRARRRLDGLYRARKSLFRFLWALGPEVFFRLMLSVVLRRFPTLDETLRMAETYFQVRMAAVISPYAEIVLDIDEPEDYAAAARYLERHASAPESLCAAA